MKKLLILFLSLCAVGCVCAYMLTKHSDLQSYLPQTTEEETEEKTEENVTEEKSDEPVKITFSKNDNFYDVDIEVELKCNTDGAVIYYTTDGNDPTTESKEYSNPISVQARNKVNATTIKAIAVVDGQASDIFLKSYVTGKNVFSRFDEDTLVFVLSTDEYNLYDYYNGVATEGYMRDEYLNSDEYDGGEIDYNAPANWFLHGRESERDMYVEVYTASGEQLISQAAGGRVVGGVSRAVDQKSWRLIARNIYSEGNGKFKYPFFTEATDAYGNLMTRYDRITLRNNANDREFASVRDELSMTLARQAGFPDTQQVRAAAVFLNSEYYGFSWLHEAYCNDYLAATYGGEKDNFRIVGSKEKEVEGDDEQSVSDWNNLLELARDGLTDDNSFNQFCELVDLDNLMLYYAIQIYIDNKDWPGNNFKAWRYYPSEGEEITSEYLDGKWRFLLFDAEYAWGLYGNGYRDDTLANVLSGNHMQGSSDILNALLERDDMKEKFANTICDLFSGAFSSENAVNVLEQLIDECDIECMYALENGYTSTWANASTFADSRQQIRDFAEKRPMVMKKSIINNFEYENEYYTVTLRNPTGAESTLSSQIIAASGTLTGEYFTACSVQISAQTYDGYLFDHWEINGQTYTQKSVTLDSSLADENGNISVILYVNRTGKSGVYISEVYTAGSGDWIELYNSSDEVVTIKNYYLSDKDDKLQKWEIPETIIPAHGTFTVACKNNEEESALKKYRTNFSLKTGETLFLTDESGNILSKVSIVEMEETQSLTRKADGKYTISSVTPDFHDEK